MKPNWFIKNQPVLWGEETTKGEKDCLTKGILSSAKFDCYSTLETSATKISKRTPNKSGKEKKMMQPLDHMWYVR